MEEIWLPVGGGGLAGGNVLSVGDSAQVVGAGPLLASDAHESLRWGTSAADGAQNLRRRSANSLG